MSEFQSDISGLAGQFARVSSEATASSNLQRLQIAEGNVRAATDQIELEETVGRREIARSLAAYQGSQRAARAFRGTGFAGSGDATVVASTQAAADQVAIVESNAAAKEIATLAANQVVFDDPVLAAIQGATEGLNIGTQIAQALIAEGEVETRSSSRQLQSFDSVNGIAPPTFQNTITSFLEIPGLDLGDIDFDFNL